MVGQLFAGIDKEYRHGESFFFQPLEEGLFLEAIGFAAKSFDAIAVDGLFEIAAAGAEAGLKGGGVNAVEGIGRA